MAHPSLGARLYGVWFGVFTMVMAACAPAPDVATSGNELGQVTLTPTQRGDGDLSLKERIRAVAARSRAARDGRAPRESIRRTFDRMGRLKEESVWRDTMWVPRGSTLSAELSAKPLASFLVSPRQVALLTGDSLISGTASGTVYDSTSSSNKAFADTTLTNFTTGLSIDDRSATEPRLLMEANLYASNPAYATTSDSITSAALYSVAPGTSDEIQEVTFGSSDMASVRYFISQTNVASYYPTALRERGLAGAVDATRTLFQRAAAPGADAAPGLAQLANGLGAQAQLFHHADAGAAREKANCLGLLYDMAAYLIAGAVVIIAGVFVIATGHVAAGSGIIAVGAGLIGMGLYSLIRWGLCRVAGAVREKPAGASASLLRSALDVGTVWAPARPAEGIT